ncbi:hypothetical protein HK097_005476 [Rhizophlyctis rosea]|uniref:Uncharacterized protein n=1 Tax=Rhizophlyctis rosea TaxID=64517 RepID=A0AAD5X366_9FUNG|nr:hypothetical protein HK097_005476 [Rhizophlyctis rosea]
MLAVGSGATSVCRPDVEDSFARLPIANRSVLHRSPGGRECARRLGSVDLELFQLLYDNVLLPLDLDAVSDVFPSVDEIIKANIYIDGQSGEDPNGENLFGSIVDLPLPLFHTLKLRQSSPLAISIPRRQSIPKLGVESGNGVSESSDGPVVDDVFQLLRVVLKLRAADVARKGIVIEDMVLDVLVDAIRACGTVANVNGTLSDISRAYQSLSDSVVKGKRGCTDSIFGGADWISKLDTAIREEENRQQLEDMVARESRDVEGHWTSVDGESHRVLWFSECTNSTSLGFNGLLSEGSPLLEPPVASSILPQITKNATVRVLNDVRRDLRTGTFGYLNGTISLRRELATSASLQLAFRLYLNRTLIGPHALDFEVLDETGFPPLTVPVVCGKSPGFLKNIRAGSRPLRVVESTPADPTIKLLNRILLAAKESPKLSSLPVAIPARYLVPQPSTRNSIQLQTITPDSTCIMAPATLNATSGADKSLSAKVTSFCENTKSYAKWFREAAGGVLSDNWVGNVVRRRKVAADWGNIPVAYDLMTGNGLLKVVSYDFGSEVVSTSRWLENLSESPIIQYLYKFDIVLLQNLPQGAAIRRGLGKLLGGAQNRKVTFQMSEVEGYGGLEIYWKVKSLEDDDVEKERPNVEAVDCLAESYGSSRLPRSVLGCIFAVRDVSAGVSNASHIVIANLNDSPFLRTLSNTALRTNDKDTGILQRVYRDLVQTADSSLLISGTPAVFLGNWQTNYLKPKGTYDEFLEDLKAAESQM